MSLPPKPKKKERAKITTIEGKKIQPKIVKECRLAQSDYPRKFFVIQELEFEDKRGIKSKREIRIGYYIIGKKGRAKGKWWWGQSCPLLPKKDMKRLIKIIKKKGFV